MQRQRDGLVPIGEAFGDLDGPVKAIREASPQALRHFTRFGRAPALLYVRERSGIMACRGAVGEGAYYE